MTAAGKTTFADALGDRVRGGVEVSLRAKGFGTCPDRVRRRHPNVGGARLLLQSRTAHRGLARAALVDHDQPVVGERAGEGTFAGELYAIYVLDSAQRQGYGRELVRAVAGALREMKLPDMIVWVLRENSAARRFYERLGGIYVRSQPTTIGTATLEEVSYGWRALDAIRY